MLMVVLLPPDILRKTRPTDKFSSEEEAMTVAQILSQAREEKRTVLTEIEAKQILGEAGINCTPTVLATSKEKAVSPVAAGDIQCIPTGCKTPMLLNNGGRIRSS